MPRGFCSPCYSPKLLARLSSPTSNQFVHSARRIILALCLIGVASASDLAASYQQAVVLSEAQEKAPATHDYLEKALLPYYQQKYGPVFQSCLSNVSHPDYDAFSFVVAIADDGHVLRVYEDRTTNIFRCALDRLKADTFPAPPESPFYLDIGMRFDGPPPGENGSADGAPPLILGPSKYSYTFGVPAGWEFSIDQARQRGVTLAFFPKGGSFGASSSVVYVNELDNPCSGEDCLSPVSLAIAQTLREARADDPGVEVATADPIPTKDGDKALVRTLKGSHDPRNPEVRDNEALAFIGHDETIILVVLTARDSKTWDRDYAAFREIVGGHKFFTCDSPNLAVPCRK